LRPQINRKKNVGEKPSVAREIASVLGLIQNMMAIMKATAMPLPIPLGICAFKEPNDYKSY
jgi:Na+/glutamate symporter